MQDLKNAEFVFGGARMNFDTLGSPNTTRPLEDLGVQEKLSSISRKERLPMLTGRQIAYQICAYFKINDVHRIAFGMNDLLNIELRNDNLMMFDQSWDETLTATVEGT